MASILKHPFPYLIIHLLFGEISRALPFSPLVTTDPVRWWGHYLFTPDHDSGTSLATSISHPSTEGIFTSSRMSRRRERRSSGTVLLKAQLAILSLLKFHSFACDDDLIYLLFPKTNHYHCVLLLSIENATLTIFSVVYFRTSKITTAVVVTWYSSTFSNQATIVVTS